jgi:hypothetical protein
MIVIAPEGQRGFQVLHVEFGNQPGKTRLWVREQPLRGPSPSTIEGSRGARLARLRVADRLER